MYFKILGYPEHDKRKVVEDLAKSEKDTNWGIEAKDVENKEEEKSRNWSCERKKKLQQRGN